MCSAVEKGKESKLYGEKMLPIFTFFTLSLKKYTYQSHLMDFLFYED
jgi:hypothetical protein